MATLRWRGTAVAVAQVTDYVFGGTWEATDIINLTVGSKTLTVVAGSTVIATIISSIVSAWNALAASVYPEHAEITASLTGSSLRLTADTAGVPFTCSVTTTETGGTPADAQTIDGAGTSAGTDSTACSGPNFWNAAANWDTATVPVNGDTVFAEHSDVSILYGLAQSAVTLLALNVASSFTGSIGLPERNTDGSASYYEYRSTYLAISATTVNIGDGLGQGSGRIKLNTGSNATTINIRNTSQGAESDLPAFLWKGANAANALNVTRGSVGVAFYGGETATLPTLRVGYQTSESSDATVIVGAGATLTTLNQSGGTVALNAGLTTVSKSGGDLTINQGNVTTLTDDSGTTLYRGVGTITTLSVGNAGLVDFGRDMRGRTVTSCNLYAGCTLNDPYGTVTFTNPIQLVRCNLRELTLDLGRNRTYAVA